MKPRQQTSMKLALTEVILLFLPLLVLGTDPEHEALIDLDLNVASHLGQRDFPERWQREVMAETALWRLQAAEVLPFEEGQQQALPIWRSFRTSGYYEALLHMVRITGFQMFDKPWPNAWSMWGVEASFETYLRDSRYSFYRDAARGFLFEPTEKSSRLAQATTAYIMAAKFDVDLKGKVGFYDKPFYNISNIVEALIKIKDPTCYFKGDQGEGERILRTMLLDIPPPVCLRDMHIAVAFDSYNYTSKEMNSFNNLLGDIMRRSPHAKITIRGTSRLSSGFPEGATMDWAPTMPGGSITRHFEILDLINQSFEDLIHEDLNSHSGFNSMKTKVVIIISKLRDRKADIERAKDLWDNMSKFGVEPLYISVESEDIKRNEEDLLPLLGGESWRGIITGSSDSEVMRLALHRMLRLICQSPSSFFGRETLEFNVYDRFYFIHPVTPLPFMYLSCWSHPSCDFSIYVHRQRYVNEYFHEGQYAFDNYEKVHLDFRGALMSKRIGSEPLHFLVVVSVPTRFKLFTNNK